MTKREGKPSDRTVAKLMRVDGIRSKVKRCFVVRTTDSNHELPIAPNRLNREFEHYRTREEARQALFEYIEVLL